MTDEMKTLGTHWDGCEEVHPHCKIAKLERELAQAEEVIRECEPVIRSALDWFSHTKEERKYLAALDKLAAYRGGKNARS